MNLREAAEQALRQLQKDDVYLGHRSKTRADAIEALRQALAEPDLAKVGEVGLWGENREWVGLTADELNMIVDKMQTWNNYTLTDVYYGIEDKLKEKNNG